MRTAWEICQFELRQQLKSPFVMAVLIVFFVIHLLAITSTGINLWTHPLTHMNSAYAIGVTETTLAIFGMLPVMVFVSKAILRDHDTLTAAFFFVKPIHKAEYLGGRFTAAALLASLVGLVGLAGSLVGTLLPGIEPERIAPFTFEPFLFCYFAIVLPTMLIQCALFFSAATLTRSLAATVALALVFMMANLTVASYALARGASGGSGLLVLADHTATLIVEAATRNLTVSELNTLLPTAQLLENRLIWLAVAAVALWCSFARFRFEASEPGGSTRRTQSAVPVPGVRQSHDASHLPLSRINSWLQLWAQARVDLSFVLRSPLFLLILVLGAVSALGEHETRVSPLAGVPLYPVTSIMLGFFRYGLLQFILAIAIYYSGALLHRERESGVAEIVGATSSPDWVLPLSKILALCTLVAVLLATTMITSIAIQAASGYTDFEIGLYLRAVFVNNGAYFWMLCVLAVFVQVVFANKWLGMLALFALYVLLLSLGALGFEHVLYGFAIPYVVYSDMNGYGHVGWQIESLLAYWACFCVLLAIAAHLLHPRGVTASFKERLREAVSRFTVRVGIATALATAGFVACGSWIFYNTNVLNTYRTGETLQQAQADYEKKYGMYESRPAPSPSDIDMAVDIFPEERRLESRGKSILTNNKQVAIDEFVMSVNSKMQVNELSIDGARLKFADADQGFYLFAFETPLQPGMSTVAKWNMSRLNRGFANSSPDVEVVENGTFIEGGAITPVPGYDETRKLDDNAVRRKFALEAAPSLPALGDPKFLNTLVFGVDGRTGFRVLVSTSADQIAVASGTLKREWVDQGRRYFEYIAERPIWPALAFTSARYEVARDKWQDVALEVYYDPAHAYNVAAMLDTAKRSLQYFTREFAPYPFSYFRIVEYPRYRTAARAFPGMVPYSGAAGFMTDLTTLKNTDYATIHELSHMWWGHLAYGARMQGREVLNESLAQYSTLVVFEKNTDPAVLHRLIGMFQRGYLTNRGKDGRDEQPVIRTDDQGYLSYNKAPLAIYALREVLGEAAVNQALRNYLAKFAFKPPPFPTSLDLVNEFRAVASPEHQEWITDLFEKIVLYDLEMSQASVTPMSGAYEITLTVNARQLEADGRGAETEVPLRGWFDVAIFAGAEGAAANEAPLYLKKHRLQSGVNKIFVRVADKPGFASIDPYRKMSDRQPENNGRILEPGIGD